MDISLREWLIIGGVLIVILILVDGWRRVSANRSRLKLEIDRTLSELGDGGDGHNPELPNGGARKRQGAEAPPAQPPSMRSRERVEPSLEPSVDTIPELTEMDPLFDDIPTREEASAARSRTRSRSRKPKAESTPTSRPAPVIEEPSPEPLFDESDVSARNDDELLQAVDRGDLQGSALEMDYPLKEEPLPVYSEDKDSDNQQESGLDLDQPIPTLFDQIGTDLPDDTLAAYRDSFEREAEREESVQVETGSEYSMELVIEPAAETSTRLEPSYESAPEPSSEPEVSTHVEDTTPVTEPAPVAKQGPKRATLPDPEHVLVITVVGRNGERLPGPALGKIVDACGMDWGDMSIYHRAEDNSPGSPIQFSMANAVAPGTFDPENMDALETPAVTFFMSMSEPHDPMTAYECMLATAETLAKHLNGELIDEDRSVMRPQTKEHYRERIREFQMHQRQRRVN